MIELNVLVIVPAANSVAQSFAINVPPKVLATTCAVEEKHAVGEPPGTHGVDIVSPEYAMNMNVDAHVRLSVVAREAHVADVVALFPRFPVVPAAGPYNTIGYDAVGVGLAVGTVGEFVGTVGLEVGFVGLTLGLLLGPAVVPASYIWTIENDVVMAGSTLSTPPED